MAELPPKEAIERMAKAAYTGYRMGNDGIDKDAADVIWQNLPRSRLLWKTIVTGIIEGYEPPVKRDDASKAIAAAVGDPSIATRAAKLATEGLDDEARSNVRLMMSENSDRAFVSAMIAAGTAEIFVHPMSWSSVARSGHLSNITDDGEIILTDNTRFRLSPLVPVNGFWKGAVREYGLFFQPYVPECFTVKGEVNGIQKD